VEEDSKEVGEMARMTNVVSDNDNGNRKRAPILMILVSQEDGDNMITRTRTSKGVGR
jgi:hypothetical protein